MCFEACEHNEVTVQIYPGFGPAGRISFSLHLHAVGSAVVLQVWDMRADELLDPLVDWGSPRAAYAFSVTGSQTLSPPGTNGVRGPLT